jgi:hypothetical protein
VTIIECPRESDVLDAVASEKWPYRVAAELADHVESCAVCSDVLAVATAMRAAHEQLWQSASIPSSGHAWWRAELRVRQEAVRKASRPIAVAQAAAVLVALGVAGTAAWLAWSWIGQDSAAVDLMKVTVQAMASPLARALVVATFALAVVAPVVFYAVLSDE